MQQQQLDIQGSSDGFRLDRAEVFNWGTFNGRVWTIVANGETTLMTGDVGSGKSSAGDALQTLLVPPRKVAYNKAADVAARERTGASYVRGQYSNNIDEETKKAKPVFLRGTNTYSTILAVFRNRNLKEVVTLVQVLWIRNEGESPQRLYIVAEKDLGVESHFTGFETIAELKRRLDSDSAIHLHDSFEKYSKHFCRLMGIPGDQALSLFCHTMSMKQVPNLTTFIRDFMLDEGNTPAVVDEVIEGFDSLSEAHEAVVKAQKKIELLQPVDEEATKFQGYLQTVAHRAKLLEAVRPYYASLNIDMIEKRIEILEGENSRAKDKLSGLLVESAHLKEKAEELRNSIVDAIVERLKNRGGDFTAIDKEWRNKVTVVRKWFDFMAHEKFRETNAIKCVYEGSSGRSGGQKEKLAYTILASALAYQIGAEKPRSFRFVIVDEAFGRGSEESARFDMELFGMLNLQLLVLTPLQKINVIEKYISSVNFVHNNAEGSCSVLRNMTIEELNQERLGQSVIRNVS